MASPEVLADVMFVHLARTEDECRVVTNLGGGDLEGRCQLLRVQAFRTRCGIHDPQKSLSHAANLTFHRTSTVAEIPFDS